MITNGVQPGGCFDGNPQQLLAGAAAGQLGCWAGHFFGGNWGENPEWNTEDHATANEDNPRWQTSEEVIVASSDLVPRLLSAEKQRT